jgi:hypothetical protein
MMTSGTRELYRSSNGDQWHLVRETDSGRVLIKHQPNAASGGRTSYIEIAEFLTDGGRRGCGRGRVPRVIIAPPQQGQRSSGRVGLASSAGAIIGAGAGTASSFRQSASFAARWPLARKP